MNRPFATRAMLITLLMILLPQSALASGEKTFSTLSDIGAYGLAAVAVGLPLADHDTQGAVQAGGSLAAAQLVTFGLKEAFPELRPDGSNRKSFPSGHTSLSFAAASSLLNRQGQSIGIPALLVASFVGVARVKADKHHWYDVVAGAAIGSASGFLITRNRPQHAALIVPWGDSSGGGVVLAVRF